MEKDNQYGVDTPFSPVSERVSGTDEESETEDEDEYEETEDDYDEIEETEEQKLARRISERRLMESAANTIVYIGMQESYKDPDPNHVCVCDKKCGMRYCECKSECDSHKEFMFAAPECDNGSEGRELQILSELQYAGALARPINRFKRNKPMDSEQYIPKKLYKMAIKLWRRNGLFPTRSMELILGHACLLEDNIRRLIDSSAEASDRNSEEAPCGCSITPCAHAVRSEFLPTLWPGRQELRNTRELRDTVSSLTANESKE